MACFARLPPELVLCVLEALPPSGLAAISACDRRHHALAFPLLIARAVNHFPHILFWAAEVGLPRLVERLLEGGASPNICFRSSFKRKQPNYNDPIVILNETYNHNHARQSYEQSVAQLEGGSLSLLGVYPYPDENEGCVPESVERASDDVDDGTDESTVSTIPSYDSPYDHHYADLPDSCDLQQYDPCNFREWTRQYSRVGSYWFPLHVAAQAGHDDIVRILVKHNACLDAPSKVFCECFQPCSLAVPNAHFVSLPPAWTPLHSALCGNRQSTSRLLLSLGASVTLNLNTLGYHALHSAAFHDCVEVVQFLVGNSHKLSVDLRDHRDLTPLFHSYAGPGNGKVSRWLLENGADVDVDLGNGCTLLHAACLYGWYAVALEILPYATNLDALWFSNGSEGDRAIELCCVSMDWDDIMPLDGANARCPDEDQIADTNRLNLVKRLVERGINIHYCQSCSQTPLVLAASTQRVEIMSVLVHAGAKLDETDTNGIFPLLAAARSRHDHTRLGHTNPSEYRNTICWLLEHGAPVNQQSVRGETPLHALCGSEFSDKVVNPIVIDLLKHGADPRLSDSSGTSPLQTAFCKGKYRVCQTLVNYDTKSHIQPAELKRMFVALLERALQATIEPSHSEEQSDFEGDIFDFTPGSANAFCNALHWLLYIDKDKTLLNDPETMWHAAREPDFPFAEILLHAGNPNVMWTSDHNETCIHTVIRCDSFRRYNFGRAQLIEELVARGLDVNMGNPILLAIGTREWTLAKLLLEYGAHVPWPTVGSTGFDPLNTVIMAAYPSRVGWLTEMVLKNLSTPLTPAAQCHYLRRACRAQADAESVTALLDYGADVNAADSEGNTPLSFLLASYSGFQVGRHGTQRFVDVLKVLIENGVRLQIEGGGDCLELARSLMDYDGEDRFRRKLACKLKMNLDIVPEEGVERSRFKLVLRRQSSGPGSETGSDDDNDWWGSRRI